jgi:hypothetical protein
MSKQSNLVIGGEGGGGNSYELRRISDRRILHRAIDSERENSTLKRFHPISQRH